MFGTHQSLLEVLSAYVLVSGLGVIGGMFIVFFTQPAMSTFSTSACFIHGWFWRFEIIKLF